MSRLFLCQALLLCFVLLACYDDYVQAFRAFPSAGRHIMSGRHKLSMSSPEGSIAVPEVTTLKQKLQQDMKDAMRNKEKVRLSAIRAIQSAAKQKEIDDRVEVTDEMIITIMSKLVKQRKESIKSYIDNGRPDLAEAEQEECDQIIAYMPKQMTEEEVAKYIEEVVTKVGATTVKDMGKVMAEVRPALTGKADLGLVGDLIKKRLGGK